jgi:ubiquinone/menaquinone biosynthesis C-methylase UbiE
MSGDSYSYRAELYGHAVKTYRDPSLVLGMLEGLALNCSIKALDMGAGQGDGSRHLRAIGANMTYLDRNEEMLKRGVERNNLNDERIVLWDMNTLPLPFADNTFDIVFSRYAIHDVEFKGDLFKDIARIIRPGGKIQIVDMSIPNHDETALAFYNEIHSWKTRGERQICWIVSEDMLTDLLKKSGFRILLKNWYRSKVSSKDWLKEDQIDQQRAGLLLQKTIDWISHNSSFINMFDLAIHKNFFNASFPVLLLTAELTFPSTTR